MARYDASDDTDPGLPPMGLRLKASNVASPPPKAKVVTQALKTYGDRRRLLARLVAPATRPSWNSTADCRAQRYQPATFSRARRPGHAQNAENRAATAAIALDLVPVIAARGLPVAETVSYTPDMTSAGIRLVRRTHLDTVRYVGCLCCA